jgi:hypothetical protein
MDVTMGSSGAVSAPAPPQEDLTFDELNDVTAIAGINLKACRWAVRGVWSDR